MREHISAIRLSETELATIRIAARRDDRSVSSFFRIAALDRCRQLLGPGAKGEAKAGALAQAPEAEP